MTTTTPTTALADLDLDKLEALAIEVEGGSIPAVARFTTTFDPAGVRQLIALARRAAQPAEGAGQAGQVAEITDGAPQWRPAVEAPRDGTRFWHIKRVVKAAVGKRPCAHYEFQVVRRKFSGEPSGGYWTNDYRSIPDSEIMCGWIIVPDCTAPTERAAAPAEHKRVIEFALELAEHENDDAAVSFLKAWNSEDAGYLRANWPDFATHQPSAQVKP